MLKPNTIEICDMDQTYVQIVCGRDILSELSEHFTFDVPGAQFTPAYKNKAWDGKFRMIELMTGRIYKGLTPYIVKWAKDNEYAIEVEKGILADGTKFDVDEFTKSLNLAFEPYDFQSASVKHVIENNRACLLSPTSSGKSLIMYCLMRWFIDNTPGKVLICVPTVGLVTQLYKEFQDYCPAWDLDSHVHKIYQGEKKVSEKKVYISTWQSIYKMPRDYFTMFDSIMCDESHTLKADALKGIFEKAPNASYRIGLTGTLDGAECNKLVIEGLTGPVFQVTRTKELMERGIVSDLIVKCMVLDYDDETRKENKDLKFHEEMDYIVNCKARNKFIKNLVLSIKDKNCLILTAYIKHTELMKKELEGSGKTVYVVTGAMDATERERIRQLAEKSSNLVIIATFGVFSTGISVKNLQYIFFATGSKSMIRVLQSIGRGLRLDGKDNKATVIDIIDDFGHKSKRNTIFRHFFERVKIYMKEDFPYRVHKIKLNTK